MKNIFRAILTVAITIAPLSSIEAALSEIGAAREVEPAAYGTVPAGEPEEIQLNDENKEVFGASYFWVMDLAGSMWERVVTVGDPKLFWRMTLRPLGPSVTFTARANLPTPRRIASRASWSKAIIFAIVLILLT